MPTWRSHEVHDEFVAVTNAIARPLGAIHMWKNRMLNTMGPKSASGYRGDSQSVEHTFHTFAVSSHDRSNPEWTFPGAIVPTTD